MPAYDKKQLLKSAYNYAQASQWDRALDEYRKVAKLFPDDANIHSMVADILARKGDASGAAAEHLEAARLFKDQNFDDKELAAIKKALRVQSGHPDGAQRLESHLTRQLARANQLLANSDLDGAEALGQKLLDAEPGHLGVNRLLDDVRSHRTRLSAAKALRDEQAQAAPSAGDQAAAEATHEVLERLKTTADQYLAAENFDDAIGTLMIMIKIDPARIDLRQQMEKTQEALKKKQAAQSVWQSLLAKDAQRVTEAKVGEMSAQEVAEWAQAEQAVRERLVRELAAADEAAKFELEVIEKAMGEIRHRGAERASQGQTFTSMPTPFAPPEEVGLNAQDEARLRELEEEKHALEDRLKFEKEAAQERESQLLEQTKRDGEMLHHAIEMARQEAEVQAKAEALKELERRMAIERAENEKKLVDERGRIATQEKILKDQLQELMRSEIEKIREEMHQKAVAEIEGKLKDEHAAKQRLEEQAKVESESVARRAHDEQEHIEAARKVAEDRARVEREAVIKLKVEEGARKTALVEEALKRRNARLSVGGSEDKTAVMKASRRISDALHAAATKHIQEDVNAMIDTARRYMAQDLLLDAMRICQTIAAKDPDNDAVRKILKEIYVKKGLEK